MEPVARSGIPVIIAGLLAKELSRNVPSSSTKSGSVGASSKVGFPTGVPQKIGSGGAALVASACAALQSICFANTGRVCLRGTGAAQSLALTVLWCLRGDWKQAAGDGETGTRESSSSAAALGRDAGKKLVAGQLLGGGGPSLGRSTSSGLLGAAGTVALAGGSRETTSSKMRGAAGSAMDDTVPTACAAGSNDAPSESQSDVDDTPVDWEAVKQDPSRYRTLARAAGALHNLTGDL